VAGLYGTRARRIRQRYLARPSEAAIPRGAPIWNTPALDPQLGLIYFATGNCGPDYDGSMREGDNLFCASIMALNAKTGEYVWHFQEVHHDIWDYDAASLVVLFDTVIDGQPPQRHRRGRQDRIGLYPRSHHRDVAYWDR